MRSVLVWTVRASAVAGWVSALVACVWLFGTTAMPAPNVGPLVWGSLAAGCAVVRAGALWALRGRSRAARGRRRTSLRKRAPYADTEFAAAGDAALGVSFGSPLWIKSRAALVWALAAFSAGAMMSALMSGSGYPEKVRELRASGAVVREGTVVERPRPVGEETSEGEVIGHYSDLVVSVPDGGLRRLPVRKAYTGDLPRRGDRVEVMWSPSAPSAGGFVHEARDLRLYAEGRWDPVPDGEQGRNALLVVILVGVVLSSVGVPTALAAEEDGLQAAAWSPVAQTVRAVLMTAVVVGWRPVLLGASASDTETVLALGGFLALVGVYFASALRAG